VAAPNATSTSSSKSWAGCRPASSAKGKLAKFKPVFAWQLNPSLIAGLLDYIPNTQTVPAKNFVSIVAANPYFGNQSAPSSSSTDQQAFFDAGYRDVDTVTAAMAALQTYAAARTNNRGQALEVMGYEAGQHFIISDATTLNAVQRDARMQDLYMYALQQLEGRVGPIRWNHYVNIAGIAPSLGIGFGAKEYSAQANSASTPKHNAMANYNAGQRKLFALTGSLFATKGALTGDVVGSLARRTKGSSVAITSTPSGAFDFVDPNAADLQVKVINPALFTSLGSISVQVTETDARDPAGPKVTNITCPIAGVVLSSSAKASGITLSTDRLTLSPANTGDWQLDRASQKMAGGPVQFEVLLNATTTEFVLGVDDGTQDFTVAGTSGSVVPGDAGHSTTGISLRWSSGGNWLILRNGGIDQAGSFAFATSDVVSVLPNKTAGTVGFYVTHSGTTTQLGTTLTGVSWTNWYGFLGGTRPGSTSLTAVFASPFTYSAGRADYDGANGDTTAPVLSLPTGTATSSSGATVGATTNEGNGTLSAVVTLSSTQPTKAQIKAGQNAAGASAPHNSVAVSSTGAKTVGITGLSGSTAYFAHLMHEDGSGNQSNIVSSSSFTTSAAGWTPTSLGSKVKLWLKGDALSGSNGSAIATWADSSSNANDATQATSGARPTLVVNGLNSMNTVSFGAGFGQFMTLPTGLLTGLTQPSAFVLFKNTGAGSAIGPVFGNFGTDAQSNHDPYSDGNYYEDFCSTVRKTVSGVPSDTTTFRLMSLFSAAGDWRFNMNGTNYSTTATNTVGVNNAPLLGSNGTDQITAEMAEALVCEGLTTLEEQKVEGYMAWRWGRQAALDPAHPYASSAP
jgi:hypothetical protein